jgi:hypothetical protein
MAVFRSVNERISVIAIALDGSPEDMQAFICECSRIGCAEVLMIPLSVYAQVRDDPAMFLVLPGHDDSEEDEVLVRLPDYSIVRNKTLSA